MNTHDSQDHVQALFQHGQTCQTNLLTCLLNWPVAEYSRRIDFGIRSPRDQELIRSALEETVAWIKAVAAYRTLHDQRTTNDLVRRVTFATLEEDYRDTGVNDARQVIEDTMSLLPAISVGKAEAFIIMSMDSCPELEDTCDAIKQACNDCGVRAVRADDIHHSKLIIEVILELISTSQFLIADLSGEKQNVYWEIGVAQGLNKELILVCKRGTKLHFNLAGHNVLEYGNSVELKRLIIDRLQAMPKAA